jgi:5'/3'-nucleotidase
VRLLVTNDDGVDAPGIAALTKVLAAAGHEVVVVAPLEDRSGTGAGVGPVHLGGGVDYEERTISGLEEVATYAIDGLPALAVLFGCHGAFGPPPDLVVSGINMGFNTGRSVLHSGTVGAVLTAANLGVSGLAVSAEAADPMRWNPPATLASLLLEPLSNAPSGTVVNLNVPALPFNELRGLHRGRLSPAGTVQSSVVEDGGRLQLRIGPRRSRPAPDTDVALVATGHATVTLLAPVGEPEVESKRVLQRLLDAWPAEGVAS